MNFEERYRASLEKHASRPFVAVYSVRGEVTRRTFLEFDADVRAQMGFLNTRAHGYDQVVTVAGNQYPHLVTIIAAWRLGLPVCPVNPAETAERLQAKVAALGGRSLMLHPPELVATVAPLTEGVLGSPEHVSTLIFTSGSTGYSKIVEQREESLLANADDLIALHELSPEKCIATSLPIFHVNALHFSVICTLLSGARLVLLENFVLPQVWEVLAQERVNILSAVPLLYRHMLENADSAKDYDLSPWKYGVSAAAPLSKNIAREFHTRFQRKIIQGYGLSEAVNFSCLTPPAISDEDYETMFLNTPHTSIGRALPGNEVIILKDDQEVEDENTEGELALSGIYLMHGYRGDSGKGRAQHFRQPVAGNVAPYLFRTGDLGYFRKNARDEKFFYISGRKKEIVKRGGLTVSLRELDDILTEFAGAEALAVAFDNQHTGEEIGLVLTSRAPAHLQPPQLQSELSAFLQARLPAYMRPNIALLVDGPLRSSSGKAQRWTFKPLFRDYSERPVGRSLVVLDRREPAAQIE